MKSSGSFRRLRVSADGSGVVSHAGLGMLRELAEHSGLVAALNDALTDTYRGGTGPLPGPGADRSGRRGSRWRGRDHRDRGPG